MVKSLPDLHPASQCEQCVYVGLCVCMLMCVFVCVCVFAWMTVRLCVCVSVCKCTHLQDCDLKGVKRPEYTQVFTKQK
jgi:hypothetical protein